MHQHLLQVLALLEQIKRQNAGEEDMPPVVLPDGSYGRNSAAPAGSSGRDGEDEEDGFLDLEDDEEGGFLVDDFQADAIGWGSDQEDEDDQFYTKTTVAGNFAGGHLTTHQHLSLLSYLCLQPFCSLGLDKLNSWRVKLLSFEACCGVW